MTREREKLANLALEAELSYRRAPVGVDGVSTAAAPDRFDLLAVDLAFGEFVDLLLERVEIGWLTGRVLDMQEGPGRDPSYEELAAEEAAQLIRMFR